MASGAFLFCILVVNGFLSVHCTDKLAEQIGLYFVKEPKDVIGVKGEPLMLPCSANSTKGKELNLVWLHNGSRVLPDGRRRILSNGSLSITKVLHKKKGHSDEGQYRCVISEGNGRLSSMFVSLRVATMPNFAEHPKSQDVMEGSHVQMTCKMNSSSEGVITWERDDDVLLQESSKHVILSGPGINGSVIYIFNVGFEDVGKYRCTFTSSMLRNERQSRRASLTIKPRDKGEEPKFLPSSYMRVVKEGDRLSLDCVVNGSPFPGLVWRYRRERDTKSVQIFNVTETGYNIVHIENITHEQSGFYTCSASDNPTMDKTVEVRVMTRPEFVERPETVTYQAARSIRFRCKVVGDPIPTIFWMKDGYPIRISGRISLSTKVNISLGLQSSEMLVASSLASDAGIYQCVARNSVGMIWAASRLILNATKPAPKPPEKVSCRTVSSSEIAVDWDISPDHSIGGIKAFSIHYYDIDGGEELREAISPANRSVVIHSLAPYTNYTFYLRAYINSASDFSEQVICQTGEEVPQAAPEIHLVSSTPDSLKISWTPLTRKQANGKIMEYKVQWRLEGTPSNNVQHVDGSILKYDITDLLPGNEYEVRVLAATRKGWSPQNFPWRKFKLPPGDGSDRLPEPHIVLQAINSSTIKVMWNIQRETRNSVRGYKLFFRKENSTASGPIILRATESEYFITQLESATLYEVTILGFTDMGDGKRGKNCIQTLSTYETLEEKTKNISAIEPPTALEAEPTDQGVIGLSWSPPPPGDVKIKDYTVCYNPVQTSLTASKSSITCLKSLENKIIISNLEPFTLYEFKVRSNAAEDLYSNYSQSIECYTLEDVPSQVVDVRWKAENRSTVFVSWGRPRKSNGIIQNYTVFYTSDSSQMVDYWSTKVLSGTTHSTYLTNLIPNTEYFLIVRASTKAGLGTYGKPKQINIPTLLGLANKTPKKDRRNEQFIGITVGLGIGFTCIIICTICIICRRRCVKNQASEEIEHSPGRDVSGSKLFKGRDTQLDTQETEFFRYMSTQNIAEEGLFVEEISDNKDRRQNGIPNGVRKFIPGDETSKILRCKGNMNITENPRYNAKCAVSPFPNQQSPSNLDSFYDSDILSNSKVPLLKGKRKFSDGERLNKISSEDSESEREGKKSPLSSAARHLNDIKIDKEQRTSAEIAKERAAGKKNHVLENPEFRFSDSEQSQFCKSGYFLPKNLCNGAADPLLQINFEVESLGH